MVMDPTSPIDKNTGTWAAYRAEPPQALQADIHHSRSTIHPAGPFHYSIDYGVSGSFIIPVTETRLKASVGTGYKIPSLYQLYNVFERYNRYHLRLPGARADPELRRRDRTAALGNRIVLEVNYFSIDYKNLIIYDTILDSYGRYWNSNALTRGVECIASTQAHRRPDNKRILHLHTRA